MAYSKARRLSDSISATGEVSAFVDGAIVAADLNSTLDLTGKTITVANASTGDSDTTVANTAFVQQEIAALVASAPGTLNTLNELAAALGDDASFSTTVTDSIALKAPLASPTFTGTTEIPNLTIGGAQGTDGQLLTSTGSGIGWEDAPAGGVAGIVTSADATAITIDSSENVGIGNSGVASTRLAVTNSVVGVNIETTSSNTGHEALIVNRQNSDGIAIAINKAGTTVGSIGANSGDIYIASTGTYSAGLMFEGSSGAQDIRPCSSTGALLDGAVDLGDSSARFKDLYLSGTANVGSITAPNGFLGGTNGGLRIHSGGTKFFNITAANAARDGIMDIGAADARFKDLHLSGTAAVGVTIAKEKYQIGDYATHEEEFGVSAVNGGVDSATNNINTTASSYENRSGVYWLHYNSKKFRGFVRPNWMQGRNWVLAAKFFSHDDMPAGSVLWQNDASWNGGDFDLNNGHFSKYGNIWRYFGFNRLAMQMGNRVAPIMQFNSTQTLYGAFSGGLASNGGVTADSTDPSLGTGTAATYHAMTNYMGPTFTDLGGAEDRMQPYGLNKWLGSSSNSTSSNNQGSGNVHANVSKGFQLTVEDNHPNITGLDSIGRAGAWIGCAMDEQASSQANATGSLGADSAFGFGGACGNNARTWTSGYAEWARGNEVANLLPGYIWLSID